MEGKCYRFFRLGLLSFLSILNLLSSKVSRTSNYHNQLIRLFRCIKYSNIDAESTTQKDRVLATWYCIVLLPRQILKGQVCSSTDINIYKIIELSRSTVYILQSQRSETITTFVEYTTSKRKNRKKRIEKWLRASSRKDRIWSDLWYVRNETWDMRLRCKKNGDIVLIEKSWCCPLCAIAQ